METADSEIVYFSISSQTRCYHKDLNLFAIDLVNDSQVSCPNAAIPCKFPGKLFPQFVRLAERNSAFQDFDNFLRVCFSQTAQIAFHFRMEYDSPDHQSFNPRSFFISSSVIALDSSNVAIRSAASASMRMSASSSIKAS